VSATTVVLVRHGETDWNREGRIQGWAPSQLTDRGHQQARALGGHLADAYDVDRLVASDLRRTRETTALLRDAGVDAEPTFDRAWRERDFGVLQGFPKETIFEQFPEYAADSGVVAARERPERGETLLEARERVLDGFGQVLDGDAETVLVVTHGGPIYLLLGHVRGQDVLTAVTDHSQHNCALNELRVGEESESRRPCETVEVVRHNETTTGRRSANAADP
jgi:probable phosphoglycerate mutase